MPSASPDARADSTAPPTRPWLGWLAVFAGAMLLYGLTASTQIQWQDYGDFVMRIVAGELVNPLGLALAHPLHYWIGRASLLLPLEPPHAVALVSALFGAVTVANVHGLVRHLTRRHAPALIAAAGLAVAHTFWRMSTMPECYTITTAALSAEMWAVVLWARTHQPRWIALAFLANGLGLSNHNLALLTLPVLGVVLHLALWRRQLGSRAFVAAALLWLLGASIYLGLVVQQMVVTGEVRENVRSALVGKYTDQVLGRSLSLRNPAASVAFTLLSFPNLMLPAAAVGLWLGPRVGMPRLAHAALLASIGIHLAFVLRYNVIDQYTFLLPSYTLMAIFAGIGFAAVQTSWPERARLLLSAAAVLVGLTPILYFAAPALARQAQVLGAVERNKPYRDDYRYLFIPWGRGHDSAARMSEQALELAGETGLIIVEDGMASFAVRYQLIMHGREQVEMLRDHDAARIQQAAGQSRPVVLVPARTDQPPPAPPTGSWQREGDLYLLHAPQPRS
jgi:hypothetical protein